MKQLFAKTAIILLTLSAFFSCGDNTITDDTTNKILKKVCIKAEDFRFDKDTRSSVNITDWGVEFAWDDADTVGIFPTTGSQVYFAMEEGEGTSSATFDGGGWALKSSSTYSAYYPYNILNRQSAKVAVNYEGQTQVGNANTGHISAYDFMASNPEYTNDDEVHFSLNHLGCFLMLNFVLEESKYFTKVTLKANDNVFTIKGFIDLTKYWPGITPQRSMSTYSVTLEDFYVSAGETSTIYLMIAPVDLWGQNLDIILTDEFGQNLKYEVEGKYFYEGGAFAYTLTNGEYVELPPTPVYVDLGLPSGTLWADRNVGAASPDDFGNLFAWGETEQKELERYTEEDYSFEYCKELPLENDAAYVNMGVDWRMPTGDELRELKECCTLRWVCRDSGVYGFNFVGPNGNSIFLPAAGMAQYQPQSNWPLHHASSLYSGKNGCGLYWGRTRGDLLMFTEPLVSMHTSPPYCCGYSVRAVLR